MNLAIAPPLSGIPGAQTPSRTKAEHAARDFEAVLLTSLLNGLQKSFAGKSDDDSTGSDNYGAMGTQALASALSARGGIGIAHMILRQWQQTKVPELAAPEVTSPT